MQNAQWTMHNGKGVMQNAEWKMQNGKWKIIALVSLSAMILLAACGGETATPIPPTPLAPTDAPTAMPALPTATRAAQASGICAAGGAATFVQEIILTTNTQGDAFTPVDEVEEYEPTQQTFHAVAKLANAPANAKLRVVWYLVQAEGYKPNSKIDENELSVADGGTRNVDFTLKSTSDKWPEGSYCVEIYAEGNLALSKNFRVGGVALPSSAGADVVKQIVLAESTNPNTFEPINPTTKFKANAPLIHVALQLEKAPANTLFRARWYPPGQEPLNFDLKTDGTRWLDFQLTPAPDGFPTGEYKVEIYVNEKLADTKTFSVE